jgi:hypothetical protein
VHVGPVVAPDHEGETTRTGPISTSNPRRSASSAAALPAPNVSSTVSRSSQAPVRLKRFRRGARPNSLASRIRGAAENHLRQTGRRASGLQIYKALAPEGLVIKAQKPSAVIAAALTSSRLFDNAQDSYGDGYGLAEWSNAGAPPYGSA